MISISNAIVEAGYLPPVRGVMARLSGKVDENDVARWIELLDRALAWVPDGTEIVLLSNLHGYEPASLDAHKAMRDVIPLRLAAHGFRTALVDVVGGELEVRASPRIAISKVAHVHHDATKMASYEAQVGCDRERFFSDPARANAWLLFDP
jgi:hypothetical protein